MVNTEPLVIVPLTSSDMDDAQALVAEAGWNQTPADWRIFLELGQALSIRAHDGTLVGTAATLPYAGGFGWISMVLVAKAWRRRGIGTRLLNRCIETLRELSSIPMLDATPAGREVYRHLGFRDLWPITRWRRTAAVDFGRDATNVRLLEDRDLAQVVTLDTATFGYEPRQIFSSASAIARENSPAPRKRTGKYADFSSVAMGGLRHTSVRLSPRTSIRRRRWSTLLAGGWARP